MFAVDHALTALLLKRRFPRVSIVPMLIAVQAMELAWVALNYAGIERTTTEAVVRSVADVHLAYMPYSHSVATALGGALLAWTVLEFGLGRPALGRAVGLGIASHLVLDLLTHAPDIALWPGAAAPRLGAGLYGRAPIAASVLELVYGLACWRLYGGGSGLFVLAALGNVANLSLLSGAIPGPEALLAGHPLELVSLILVQILTTLVLVGVLSRRPTVPARAGEGTMAPPAPFHPGVHQSRT